MIKDKLISSIFKRSNFGKLSDLIEKSFFLKIPYKLISQKMISYDFPVHLFIETTNACNLKCQFCARTDKKFEIGSMDFNLFKKIINEAKEYGPRTFSLHLFGEPLLTKNIFEMIEYIKKANQSNTVFLTTNGTLLNKENAKSIIKTSVDRLSISFPSVKKESYQRIAGFDQLEKVEENINGLIELKKEKKVNHPLIYLRMVLNKDNFDEKKIFEKKWKNKPVISEIRDAHNFGGYSKEFSLRKGQTKKIKRYPCYHLWFSPAIHFNGDFSICCDDWGKKTVLGNVKNQTINQIWNSKKINQYRQAHMRGKYDKVPLCQGCDVWTMYQDIFFDWQKK